MGEPLGCFRVLLLGGELQPVPGFGRVGADAFAGFIADGEVVLSVGDALHGGFAQPPGALGGVAFDDDAFGVEDA